MYWQDKVSSKSEIAQRILFLAQLCWNKRKKLSLNLGIAYAFSLDLPKVVNACKESHTLRMEFCTKGWKSLGVGMILVIKPYSNSIPN